MFIELLIWETIMLVEADLIYSTADKLILLYIISQLVISFLISFWLTTHYFESTLPSENLAPEVSWMALGTAFSTDSGRPSCSAFGTMDLPVAWETLPVSLLEPVSWTESGSSSSSFLGACN